MELGIKKPNINFSQRDNVAGVSDRSIKKDSTNKTGILMLDQKRNKSISNATKKNYDMIKSTPIEKSSNFDQKKYIDYKRETVSMLQNQLQEKKNKSLYGNNTNNLSNVSMNSNLNKYTQQASMTSNSNMNSNNNPVDKKSSNIYINRINYPKSERDNSFYLHQQTNNLNYNQNISNSRTNRDNFNDNTANINTFSNTPNVLSNYEKNTNIQPPNKIKQNSNIESNTKNSFLIDPKHKKSTSLLSDNYSSMNNNYQKKDHQIIQDPGQSYINIDNNNNNNLKSPHRVINKINTNLINQRDTTGSFNNCFKESKYSNSKILNENNYVSNIESNKLKSSTSNFNKNLNQNSSNPNLINQHSSSSNLNKNSASKFINNKLNENQKNNYTQDRSKVFNNNLNYPKPNNKEENINKNINIPNSRSNSKDGFDNSQVYYNNQKITSQNKLNVNYRNSPIGSVLNNNYTNDNSNYQKGQDNISFVKGNELNQNPKNSISRNYINYVPEKSPNRKSNLDNFKSNEPMNKISNNSNNYNQTNNSQQFNKASNINKDNNNGNLNTYNNTKPNYNLMSQNNISMKNSYVLESKNSNQNSSSKLSSIKNNSNCIEERMVQGTPIKEDKVMDMREFENNNITNENQKNTKTKSRINPGFNPTTKMNLINQEVNYEKEYQQDVFVKIQTQNNQYQKINNINNSHFYEKEGLSKNNYYENTNSTMNNKIDQHCKTSNHQRNDSLINNSEINNKRIIEKSNSQIINNNSNSSYLTNSQSSQNYNLKNNIYSTHKKTESTTALLNSGILTSNSQIKRNNELIISQARNDSRGYDVQNKINDENNTFNTCANMNQNIINNSRSNSKSPNYNSSRNYDLKGSINSRNSYIQPKYESRIENSQNQFTPSGEKIHYLKKNIVNTPHNEKDNSSRFINKTNYKNSKANNSGYNIENSLYGSNLNGSSAKCTSYNKENSPSQFDNSINQTKNKNLRTHSKYNKSENYENDEFTFTTEIPMNIHERRLTTEENNVHKNTCIQNKNNSSDNVIEKNIYYKINPKNIQKVINEQSLENNKYPHSPTLVKNQKNNLNSNSHQRINSKFINNLNTSTKKDFSFDKNSKEILVNNTNKTQEILDTNKNEGNDINDNNDDYIENNTTNTNIETNTYRKIEKNSYYSEYNSSKANYSNDKNSRQNILNQNNEFEFRNYLCSDRTPHTKLGVRLNVNSKLNSSVCTNQIQKQIKNDCRENSSYINEYNKNANKIIGNTNQSVVNNIKYSNNISVNNHKNSIADIVSHSNNIIPSENNSKYYNVSLKSPNISNINENGNQSKFSNKFNNVNRNILLDNTVNVIQENQSNSKINSNTFNKSYINNTQNNSLHAQNHNNNTASINSTIGNNNINSNKNFIHIKSNSANSNVFANILKEKQNSHNLNRETKESLYNNNDVIIMNKLPSNIANDNFNQIKTLIETKESSKTKPHSLNYNTNFTTNHEENKFLCSKNIESIEEMHYQITAVLQSFNKIIRIQEVASEKENIFQTVNKCDEKDIY